LLRIYEKKSNPKKLKNKKFFGCPNFTKKLQIPITFDPLVQKLRNLYYCEAYYEAHLHKKCQKIPKFIAFIATCPKSQNSIYGTHSPLGVKEGKSKAFIIFTIEVTYKGLKGFSLII
jgi:hypothetical protein